jgi:hypothetical protein
MNEKNEQALDGVASVLNAELGMDLRNLAHKLRPFITAQSGNGEYKVVLQFSDIHKMHDFHRQLLLFIKG